MRLWVQACGAAVVVAIATAAGCGGNVIVDGTGGSGGEGGSGGTVPGVTVTVTSSGPTTSSVTAISVTTSITSSVSTGPTVFCDNTGDCGDIEFGCIACSINENGGPCWPAYDKCGSSNQCAGYADCISFCGDDDCLQKCAESYPTGVQPYNDLVICVFCAACYNDCGSQGAGCP